MRYPLDLPDCNYWIYALQLNTYRYILETEYGGLEVVAMLLAIVHPDMPGPRILEVPRMDEEMRAIHVFEIDCGRATESIPGESAPFALL